MRAPCILMIVRCSTTYKTLQGVIAAHEADVDFCQSGLFLNLRSIFIDYIHVVLIVHSTTDNFARRGNQRLKMIVRLTGCCRRVIIVHWVLPWGLGALLIKEIFSKDWRLWMMLMFFFLILNRFLNMSWKITEHAAIWIKVLMRSRTSCRDFYFFIHW